MKAALRVIWFTLKTVYADMFVLVGGSLVWFVLNLPLWLLSGLFGYLLAAVLGSAFPGEAPETAFAAVCLLLTALGPSPAAAALGQLTNRLAHEDLAGFGLVWDGLRRHWGRSLLAWAIGQAGLAVLLGNLYFYANGSVEWLQPVAAVFLWLGVYWLGVQLLLPALLIEQPERSVLGVLRNAAVVTIAHPLLALCLLVVALASVALAVVLAIVVPLLLGGFLSLLAARAVAELKWRYFPEEAPLRPDEIERAAAGAGYAIPDEAPVGAAKREGS